MKTFGTTGYAETVALLSKPHEAKHHVADIQEILNEEDEEVPLADQKADDHKCCILHFLIMLPALLISIFETRSMKKRQKKLQEVREELDCELARRGLLVTSEQ